MMWVELVKTLRPHQWVKNLFVLVPLVFAEQAFDGALVGRAALAFALFSLLSGCVYILNDLMDVEGDRNHPTKRHRSIAAGRLGMTSARISLGLLLAGSLGGGYLLAPEFAAIGLAYFTLNVGYSMALKHIPFLDVLTIAAGFLLRIFAGAAAVAVPISSWLMACTFTLAAFLALGKRKHELLMSGGTGAQQRRVLARYDVKAVRLWMGVLGLATLGTYGAYIGLGGTTSSFAPHDLVYTLPFVGVGIWRFYGLTQRIDDGRSPTDLMLRDVVFLLNLAGYAAVVMFVIYGA